MTTCAKCTQPTVTVHRISLDTRVSWLVCCLCAAELANNLNGAEESEAAA